MRRTLASLATVGLGLSVVVGLAGTAAATVPSPAAAGPGDLVLAYQCNAGGGTVVFPLGPVARCEGGRFAGSIVVV
ncbi:hypothetical protein [Streptomyces lushanensis]|uniref:hypothetical protein n=1 Tax=Streptomyces lushanensis TaxID=1434255 RepID=UPI0008345E17|nr:hypothetical protein [Streptomyces lushanensis]